MSARSCPVCGREAQPGWKLCPQCGSKLSALPGRTGADTHVAERPFVARHAPRSKTVKVTHPLSLSAKLGALTGLFVALIVGLLFVYAAYANPVPDYSLAAFLALPGLVPLVVCALLGLMARVSDFFPGLGGMLSCVGGLAALLALVISVLKWHGPGVVVSVAWTLEFLLCYRILRAVSPPMIRRRRRHAKAPRVSSTDTGAGRGYMHYVLHDILALTERVEVL